MNGDKNSASAAKPCGADPMNDLRLGAARRRKGGGLSSAKHITRSLGREEDGGQSPTAEADGRKEQAIARNEDAEALL